MNHGDGDRRHPSGPARLERRQGPTEPTVSGLLWPEARHRWANTAWLTQERSGSGQIIMFATDPDVRAYFYGTRKLLLNAVLYGPGMWASFEGPYDK